MRRVMTGKTQADIDAEQAKQEQELINREARKYLSETDWYIVRQQETGKAVPPEILQARIEARNRVVEI